MHGQLRDRCGWKKDGKAGKAGAGRRGRTAAMTCRCPGRPCPVRLSRQDPPFLIQAATQVKTGHACAGPGKTLHRKHETRSRIS
ncbi:hypothetical protein DESPIGER_2381 [Desulfovibrio piger]|uniref:Uncharacterized protein n=1 Tax=Desulfovibrio piger TaxID=901 RepID=A0A1K1LHN1_9BACT|nr:hypothetical protein DESPIGER_2381 [Desulfovibrio piger]